MSDAAINDAIGRLRVLADIAEARGVDMTLTPAQARNMCSLATELAAEIKNLKTSRNDLLALAKQFASECGECNGKGVIEIERTRAVPECCGQSNRDGSCCGNAVPAPEAYVDQAPCPDCADIHAVIAKAEPTP